MKIVEHPRFVIAASFVLVCLNTAVACWALLQIRNDAVRRAQGTVSNVALLVQRDIAGNLRLYDQSLQDVVDGLHQPDTMKLPPNARQKVLFAARPGLKDVGAMVVFDENGIAIFDSEAFPPRRIASGERDYFRVHRDSPSRGLYISRPITPLVDGTTYPTSVILSRRVSRADGRFAGVVACALPLSYFSSLFAQMKLGAVGSLTLSLDDGTVLMRRSADEAKITERGSALLVRDKGSSRFGLGSAMPDYVRFARVESGDFMATGALDGQESWHAVRRIGDYPMVVDVALGNDSVIGEWWRRVWIIGAMFVGLNLAIMLLVRQLTRQLKKRLATEKELYRMARTDALTGLNNRRTFEERADEEWRRTLRSGQALSVLVIDVDSFKKFNDLYGHSAGDVALQSVGSCIAERVRRAGDCSARYGGEEFVVLLPDTDEAHAVALAEQIRAEVQALAIPHAQSACHVVTLSIGVASTHRQAFTSFRELFNAADAALYAAKRRKRNCVVSAPASESADESAPVTAG